VKQSIKHVDDLRWLLGHTGGFRGGYVTDVQMSKRRLFDEGSAREVLADTSVTVVVRYRLRQMERVAKLTMTGVTDFSIFEQEGADCSSLSVIQAECTAGKLRFWFDPQGELYVVCDEAQFEEVAVPFRDEAFRDQPAQWTFQSPVADWPTVEWLLKGLDESGLPCTWRKSKSPNRRQGTVQWEGDLLPAVESEQPDCGGVHAMLYGPIDGPGFGIVLYVAGTQSRAACRILSGAADLLVRHFSGRCLVGNTIIPGGDWLNWKSLEHRRRTGTEHIEE